MNQSRTVPHSIAVLAVALAPVLLTAIFLVRLGLTASSTVCWHPSDAGLTNQDVEALAAAPLSTTVLYAGTWGDGAAWNH